MPADLNRQTYTLRFKDDGRGEPKRLEFEALSAADALSIAKGEASERDAELWAGERLICSIRRIRCGCGDLWRISG